MAYTDHSITGYVFPQDSGFSGIANSDADWANAAYIGGLGLAETSNYAPNGLGITADHGAETFDLDSGVGYIEDTTTVGIRDWDDSELTRSADWTQPFLTLMLVKSQSGISFETTSGTNYLYIAYSHHSQNDSYLRVADTTNDEPTDPSLQIGEIDASADSSREVNRVAGHNRDYIGKYTASAASSITINVPDTYDEIILKFQGVTGSYTGGRKRLQAQVNGQTGYYQRTTQGSNTGISNFWLSHDYAARANIIGEVLMTGRWPGSSTWSFNNNLTNRAGKYFAYAGWSDSMAQDGTLDSIFLEWQSGTISGEWALWGRDFV